MEPDEDPEDRIRRLERELSDAADRSELTHGFTEPGAGQMAGPGAAHRGDSYHALPPPVTPYAAPAAPSGPPTASFGMSAEPWGAVLAPPVSASTGSGSVRWVLLGVMSLVTMGIVTGSVLWMSDLFSDVSSLISPSVDRPTVPGGNGPFGQPAAPVPGDSPSAALPADPTLVGPAPGETYRVSGVSEVKTIACNDGVIEVSGISNRVVINGHCTSVVVSGIENVVTIDESDAISASGLDNVVTFGSGSPDIQNSGNANVVERR